MDEHDRANLLMRRRVAREHLAPAQNWDQDRQGARNVYSKGPVRPQRREQVREDTGGVEEKRHSVLQLKPKVSSPSQKSDSSTADSETESALTSRDVLGGINVTLALVLLVVMFSAVFVLSPGLRVFWVVMVGLVAMMGMGFILFGEWESNEEYKGLASTALHALSSLYAVVAAGFMLVLAWKLYSLFREKSNLVSEKREIEAVEVKRKRRRHEGDAFERQAM